MEEPFVLAIDALRRRRGVKWHHFDDDVLPAWVADMDFTVPDAVLRAMERMVGDADYGYPFREGPDGLDRAFVDRMRDRFGWEPDPELVRPVADLVQAILASILAFSQPGDGVVVQTPIYPPFLEAIRLTGRRAVTNPLVDEGDRLAVDVEGLERAVDAGTRILLLCNPHNPSGRVLDLVELDAVARIAVDRDLVVVADEIHCDLVYPGARHVPLATLGGEIAARTVTINSATKGFNIAGLRCAVMHLGSPALLERLRAAIPDRLLGQVSAAGVDATVAAWREGQPWLDAVMERLLANRDRVTAWAAGVPGIRHHRPEATYLAWLDCAELPLGGVPPQEFFLERGRVGLSDGRPFGPGGEESVRLNFATSADVLEQILERMDQAVGAVRAGDRRASPR